MKEEKHSIEALLRDKYGELLTLEEVAGILRYKSISAARKALSRKTFPVPMYRFKGRSGYFAKVEEVSEAIENMILT